MTRSFDMIGKLFVTAGGLLKHRPCMRVGEKVYAAQGVLKGRKCSECGGGEPLGAEQDLIERYVKAPQSLDSPALRKSIDAAPVAVVVIWVSAATMHGASLVEGEPVIPVLVPIKGDYCAEWLASELECLGLGFRASLRLAAKGKEDQG